MATVSENALKFLNALYEETGGDQYSVVDSKEISGKISLTAAETRAAVAYLHGKGLLIDRRIMGAYPIVDITSYGIDEIERARANPTRQTNFFPPAVSIINVGVMHGSSIQQGTVNSTQNAQISISAADLPKLASELKTLREALVADAKTAEQYTAIGAIASAETAAASGDTHGVGAALKGIGAKMSGWIVEAGKRIGAGLAVKVILDTIAGD